jgi:hypothetical protein
MNQNSATESDRSAFIEAAKSAAFTITADQSDDESQHGRQIIHSFAGGFLGADWDLAGVVDAIERAQQVEFGPDLLGHHLRVITHDGRLVRFEVPLPPSGVSV